MSALFELGSDEKRREFFHRLANRFHAVFDTRFLYALPKPN